MVLAPLPGTIAPRGSPRAQREAAPAADSGQRRGRKGGYSLSRAPS